MFFADCRIGIADSPNWSVAQIVAASSGFPPFFCPVIIKSDPAMVAKSRGCRSLRRREISTKNISGGWGVYDNLGLERIVDKYQSALVSDAGVPLDEEPNPWMMRFGQILRLQWPVLHSLYSGADAGAFFSLTVLFPFFSPNRPPLHSLIKPN